MAHKDSAQLEREVEQLLLGALPAGSRDVTQVLLRDSSSGPGELPRLVARAQPARELAPTLVAALASLRARPDLSVGFVSKPLAYSRSMPHGKRDHANLIRLIKGGHVRVYEVSTRPPSGSAAHRDSPYGDRYYVLHVGSP